MSSWINVNGIWKEATNVWENVNGTWKEKVVPKGNINGTWKDFMTYEQPTYYIYKDGVETVPITVGVDSSTNQGALYKSSIDFITSASLASGYTGTAHLTAVTQNAVDLTNYARVKWEITSVIAASTTYQFPYIMVSQNKADTYTSASAVKKRLTQMSVTQTVLLDVSALTGLYYIITNSSSKNSSSCEVQVSKIWLEK